MYPRESRSRKRLPMLTGLALVLGLGSQTATAAGEPLPPEQTEGPITYREGGIGKHEANAMRAAAGRYPLMLTFTEQIGGEHAFTADVDVKISSQDANVSLDTHAEAPIMLLELPQGRYDIQATVNGQTQQRTVEVDGDQTRRVLFAWDT